MRFIPLFALLFFWPFIVFADPALPADRLSAVPLSGSYPLTVVFSGSVHGSYLLRFGDQAPDAKSDACYRNNVPCPLPITASHVYEFPGTYTAEAYSETVEDFHCCARRLVGAATIHVTGGAPFSATPLSGPVPLRVHLSLSHLQKEPKAKYSVEFGDGQGGEAKKQCNGTSCTITADHTYAMMGTFHPTVSWALGTGCIGEDWDGPQRDSDSAPGIGDCAMISQSVITAPVAITVAGDMSRMSLTATPVKGDEPLKVDFAAEGNAGLFEFDPGNGTPREKFTHRPGVPDHIAVTYDVPGAYTPRLMLVLGDTVQTLKTATIIVTKSRCNTAKELWETGKIDPQTFSSMQKAAGCNPNQLYP